MATNSLKDIHRCCLCEIDEAKQHCDVCHVYLCKICVGKHISDEYDNHQIVPFEQRFRTLVYEKCEVHPNDACELQCKSCNMVVCELCAASHKSKKHEIITLESIYEKKKSDIKKDSEELQTVISQKYKDIAKELKNEIDRLDEGYEKLATEIFNKGKEWHISIDKVINKMKSEIIEMKKTHKGVLEEHLSTIKQTDCLIKANLTTIYQLEKWNVVSDIMEYTPGNKTINKRPAEVHVSFPKFHPEQIKVENIYNMFGSLTPFHASKTYGVNCISEKLESLHRELIDQPNVIHKIHTKFKSLRSISFISKEQIWTSSASADEIKCFDYGGICRDRILTKSGEGPYDIAVAPDGNLVYSDGKLHNVNQVVDGQIVEIIKLPKWKPLNLCFIASGDLLVVFIDRFESKSKLVRYTSKQSIKKQTIEYDNRCNRLYSGKNNIKYIVENRNTDICLADQDAGAVVVVNQTGNLRFRYIGNHRKAFKPFGIATNSQSHILIADGNNHCIHIVDKDGLFLRYIEDVRNPFGLCVDEYDDLFVTEYFTGDVKVIRYLMEVNFS